MTADAPAHMASIIVARPVAMVADFVADLNRLESWALGSSGGVVTAAGVLETNSRYDGTAVVIDRRIEADGRLVTFRVGRAIAALRDSVAVHLVPGSALAMDAQTTLVMMTAWRPAKTDDEHWRRTCAAHEWEVHVLKAKLETPDG